MKTLAAEYATIAKAMTAIHNAAKRIGKRKDVPENWSMDAGSLQNDITNLRVDHSIDYRANPLHS